MSSRWLAGLALASAAICPRFAHAEPSPKLTITVVARESTVATLQDRVASWFTDGTAVEVVVTSELDRAQALSASTDSVNAWVIPLSEERALVSFSTRTADDERHLLRDVRLAHGLDDLGLERLASVIHSAFVALETGHETIARAEAERALGEAEAPTRPDSIEPPGAPHVEEPRPAAKTAPIAPIIPRDHGRRRTTELTFGAAYGLRGRGAEGVAHGPEARFGVRAQTPSIAFELFASGQFLWRSHFDATPFNASVQTTAVRLRAGIEPKLAGAWRSTAEIGGGFDLASIHADATARGVAPRSAGTQLRPTASAALGVVYIGAVVDVGVYGEVTVLLDDVRYSIGTADGERRLLAPARAEPGLTLACRFRSAL